MFGYTKIEKWQKEDADRRPVLALFWGQKVRSSITSELSPDFRTIPHFFGATEPYKKVLSTATFSGPKMDFLNGV